MSSRNASNFFGVVNEESLLLLSTEIADNDDAVDIIDEGKLLLFNPPPRRIESRGKILEVLKINLQFDNIRTKKKIGALWCIICRNTH